MGKMIPPPGRRRGDSRESRRIFGASVLVLAAIFLPPLSARTLPPDAPPPTETIPQAETQIPSSEANAENIQTAETPWEPGDSQRDRERRLRVLIHTSGEVAEMDLGTYLAGVLRGEMPASFEAEALKAQAAAARTYTWYMLRTGGKHGGTADICTDSRCCQAYQSEAAFRESWGSKGEAYEQKIEDAVSATDGAVMLYGGQPVLAVFHSSSAGLTRTAGDVWSGDQPYLRPVSSPEREDSVPNYYSRETFTAAQFREKVLAAYPNADLSGPVDRWLTDAVRDEAGSVVTLRVGGVEIQGSKLRSALGLRSACFTWEVGDGSIVFYVTGYGHGVGMSQYGANQMAKDGASWQEILRHYYTGVEIGAYPP